MKTIILPGMAADSRMYADPAYDKLSGVLFSDWLPYKGEQSIPEVAARIIEEKNIQENYIVGGSSLGGIVAAEIANKIKVQKLILISSTLSPQYINPVLRTLSSLADIAPLQLVQTFAGKASLSLKNSLLEMFSKSEGSFIRTMCRAIFEWKGNVRPACEVCHIHGARDKVIYPPPHGAEIIPDGGHLIAMTHSVSVSAYIEKNTHT